MSVLTILLWVLNVAVILVLGTAFIRGRFWNVGWYRNRRLPTRAVRLYSAAWIGFVLLNLSARHVASSIVVLIGLAVCVVAGVWGYLGIVRAGWIVAPSGWYPDPTHRSDSRWWDGRSWTDRVVRDGNVGQDRI